MRSDSRNERTFFERACGRLLLSVFVFGTIAPAAVFPPPARAGTSLVSIARLAASDESSVEATRSLFRGYLSLGLLPEAADLLERKVRTGVLPKADALPLFEEVVEAQASVGEPRRLMVVCEAAIRSGVRTSPVLYHYGVALRGIRGRDGDAAAVLAQVGTEEPYRLLALYALGQIAAEREEPGAAENLFRRVEEGAGGIVAGGFLARRAARSRAELLLSVGRGAEAAPVFEGLLRWGGDPLDRIGRLASGDNAARALERLPPEAVAAMPLLERVRFHLLLGGLAREAGRYEVASERLARAGKELAEASAAPARSDESEPARSGDAEPLRRELERLRELRQELSAESTQRDEATRARTVELLVGLLLADRAASLAGAPPAAASGRPGLSDGEVEEIVRRIEELWLGGVQADQLVERFGQTLDTLQNLGHPIDRYRRLVQLENRQREIQLLRSRIRNRREVTVVDIEVGRSGDGARLLQDVGRFLNGLEEIRIAAGEQQQFLKEHFDIFRKSTNSTEAAGTPPDDSIPGTIAYATTRVAKLLPVERALEEADRAAAWERDETERATLRTTIDRQLADTLVLQARRLRREPDPKSRDQALSALERALSLASEGRLPQEDGRDVALAVGSVLAEGNGRWEPYPGDGFDERERGLATRVLTLLPLSDPPGTRREQALFLDAALRWAVTDPGAPAASRRYLERYPASPLSAEIAVRLGNAALLAGDVAGAEARFETAAHAGNPEAAAVANYMLAWVRYQSGDSHGALRALSEPLSDAAFSCGDPCPFERAVLALAVRAGKDASMKQLETYLPVQGGTCAGKAFLAALWEAEEKRGEAARAASVRDIAGRRFPADASAALLEVETVEALLRAGREGDALGRASTLRERYGPGSAWAAAQRGPDREAAAKEMTRLFRTLGERKFDEGVRGGERRALASAAALLGEYLRVNEGASREDDGDVRLKLAISLLGSGDREGGIGRLRELIAEKRGDQTGERAAVLYAETMIAGHERREVPAEDAERAAHLILEENHSEKAAALALRASTALLADGEYGRARRTAGEVETSGFAAPGQVREARLIQAQAAVFQGDVTVARDKAQRVLDVSGTDPAGAGVRARDLYLLASLKEIDGMASGHPSEAAARLEALAGKVPDIAERPSYLLRAMHLYLEGGDADGAIRVGTRFLKEYPRREQGLEAAGTVGPLLEEKGNFAGAGGLYEAAAQRFPKSAVAPAFLFRAARLAQLHGPPASASQRFAAWRAKYAAPGWQWAYATLFLGLEGRNGGERKQSTRLLEEGLRRVDAGIEPEGVWEVADLAAKARIAVGETWAEQFRNTRLVVPLEKSLAVKDRLFRRALAAYEKAGTDGPLEVALKADLLSADLLMEYGKAILSSQRPRGLKGADRQEYEELLKARAKSYIERSLEWCTGALDRLEDGMGPPDLAGPIRERLETAQLLLERTVPATEGITR